MSNNELKINKENYRIVRKDEENLLFHVPSTSLFELDEDNEKLINKLQGNQIDINDFTKEEIIELEKLNIVGGNQRSMSI